MTAQASLALRNSHLQPRNTLRCDKLADVSTKLSYICIQARCHYQRCLQHGRRGIRAPDPQSPRLVSQRASKRRRWKHHFSSSGCMWGTHTHVRMLTHRSHTSRHISSHRSYAKICNLNLSSSFFLSLPSLLLLLPPPPLFFSQMCIEFCYVAQVSFRIVTLLSLVPKHWDYRIIGVSLCMTSFIIFLSG